MKITKLDLNYFKRFDHLELDFTDEAGFPRDLIALIGDNGAGKTTILQAIALILGRATGRLRSADDLEWNGFDAGLAYKNWTVPLAVPRIKCGVSFADDELQATRDYFALTPMAGEEGYVSPGQNRDVHLTYYADDRIKAETPAALFQFRGHEYARQVYNTHPQGRGIFERVGSIRWYTQHRLATSLTRWGDEEGMDVDRLRQRLSEWETTHLRVKFDQEYQLRPGQRDIFDELKQGYQRLFPERDFVGTIPRDGEDTTKTSWFYMKQDGREYEISEMSAGEQAIFPILFDFVNFKIHHSIVLIDEIELHLHPPLQQAFVRGLRALGQNNQFIITTHSEDALVGIPNSCVRRIEGG